MVEVGKVAIDEDRRKVVCDSYMHLHMDLNAIDSGHLSSDARDSSKPEVLSLEISSSETKQRRKRSRVGLL